MYKIIIAGSRTFNNYELLEETMEKVMIYLDDKAPIIASGCASGADKLGEKWAQDYMYFVESHPAHWTRYGRRAGFIRNSEMAQGSDFLVCFWDGKSSGSEHMLKTMKFYNKSYLCVNVNDASEETGVVFYNSSTNTYQHYSDIFDWLYYETFIEEE